MKYTTPKNAKLADKTLPKLEPELVAVCGIYCAVCPVFGVKCPGCAKDPHSKDCVLFSCASRKKVKYCFQCSEFPCRTHYEKGIYTKQALDNWRRMMGKLPQLGNQRLRDGVEVSVGSIWKAFISMDFDFNIGPNALAHRGKP